MRIILVGLLALLLAACDGGGDGGGGAPAPDAAQPVDVTSTPTLLPAERASFAAGTENNPLRMVIRPVDTITVRVEAILRALVDSPDDVTADADLRAGLGLSDDLNELDAALTRDFDMTLTDTDRVDSVTVADLVRVVQRHIGDQVEAAVLERTALYIEVVTVDSYGEALRDLCESGEGIVSLAWLDGITYAAGRALNCGQPALRVLVAEDPAPMFAPLPPPTMAEVTPEATAEAEPEATPEATPEAAPEATPEATPEAAPEAAPARDRGALRAVNPGQIVVTAELGTTDLSVLDTRPLCRGELTDFYGWFVPSLVLEIEEIEPDLIITYGDAAAMLAAVAAGDCAGAGFSRDQLEALADDPASEAVRVAYTTPGFPYGVMLYPLEVALGLRLNLNENLVALAGDPDAARPLRLLLGQSALEPASDEDFTELLEFIDAAGYDLARLEE
ncbi:MAG: PhnD/SsuA/transferrin family substrate-binding protein [Chloroflexota bacterium]